MGFRHPSQNSEPQCETVWQIAEDIRKEENLRKLLLLLQAADSWLNEVGTRTNADPTVHYLRCLHEVDKGIFGLTLNPRHVVIMADFQRSFREVMEIFRVNETLKERILMVHVPQFIAYMDLPLGFTSEQVVEAQHACYDALYQRYRARSGASSANSRIFCNLLGIIMLYRNNSLWDSTLLLSFLGYGVGWKWGIWVVHEPYITTTHEL